MMTEYNKANTAVDFDPFSGDTIEKIVPATESQKEIFASCILGGEDANLAYNESLSLYFTGKLNEDALRKSLADLELRHESLRATFMEDGSKMIIYESRCLQLNCQDLEALDTSAQQHTLEKYHNDDARLAFDLLNGPLIRAALFRLSAEERVLTLTAHHIICDGWSFGILLEDLSKLYNAHCSGLLSLEKPLLFSDYVLRSLQYEQSGEYEGTLNYWKKEYEGSIPVFEIPPDFPRPPIRTYKSRRDDFVMPEDVAEAIKKTGARYGSSFVNTLMTAFEILLYKITRNPDVFIGLPTAGQAATEMYNLIGHCVNFLPLRSYVDQEHSFAEYLKKRKSKTLRDYEHQQFTFGTLVRELRLNRDVSRIPLTPISFNIDIGMVSAVAFEGLSYKTVYNKKVASTFEVFVNVNNDENGYVFQWAYNTALYKPATIASLMDKYVYLLEQIIQNPEKIISELEIDRYLLGNANTVPFNQNTTVVSLFEDTASKYSDHIALVFGKDQLTYAELNAKVNRLARYLIEKGLRKGDVVNIVMQRSMEAIVSIFAVLKCGAVYVPIDSTYPKARIDFMVEDTDAVMVITYSAFQGLYTKRAKEVLIERAFVASDAYPDDNVGVLVSGEDLMYILYTSGSTGTPKGAMIRHRNMVHFLKGMQDVMHIDRSFRMSAVYSISFDPSGGDYYMALTNGATLVIADSETLKDGEKLLDYIISNRLTYFKATPSVYKLLLDSGWNKKLPITFVSGGEALAPHLAAQLLERCNALYNVYGPTEVTIISAVSRVRDASDITIGKPITNTSVYVLDENLNPVTNNQVGELYIGGGGVGLGYYKRDELTSERFLPNKFDNGIIYKTGDLVRLKDAGEIVYIGRIDHQVKVRGFRIELGEIEYNLSLLPEVKDVAVAVKEDKHGEKSIVAYIIPKKEGLVIDKEQIIFWRKALGEHLPDYMIPNEWVYMSEFPLTPNGKIDRNALFDAAIAPRTIALSSSKAKEKPPTPLQKIMQDIWQEELNLPQVGLYDDFFLLGGHSMKALKVMRRLREETGVQLPLASLFQHATIAGLSGLLEHKEDLQFKLLVGIKTTGNKIPVYLIHGGALNILLYKSLSRFLDEEQPLYGIQAMGLDGDLSGLKDIDTIAHRYVREIVNQNPTGPYIIAGYSLGGIIAVEMVRQLIEMGKDVKMLGILDTNVSGRRSGRSLGAKLQRQAKKFGHIFKSFLQYPAEVFKYQMFILGEKLNTPVFGSYDEDEQVHDYPESVSNAYHKAYCAYKLTPLNVEVHLFRVKKRIYFVDDPVNLGWKEYALKGVKIHDVPGDHKTFLWEPYNQAFAQELQKVVNML
ncbi:MAG: amino acid adenylation domain-containing protein [Niabella sp.]